jgi:hypothetical protein
VAVTVAELVGGVMEDSFALCGILRYFAGNDALELVEKVEDDDDISLSRGSGDRFDRRHCEPFTVRMHVKIALSGSRSALDVANEPGPVEHQRFPFDAIRHGVQLSASVLGISRRPPIEQFL